MVQTHFWITILFLIGVAAIFGRFLKIFIKEKKKGFEACFSLFLVFAFCSMGAWSIWLSHEIVLVTDRFCKVADKIMEIERKVGSFKNGNSANNEQEGGN